MVAKNKIQLEF